MFDIVISLMNIWKRISTIVVIIFALIGFALVSGYIVVRLGLTNTSGIVDSGHRILLGGSAIDSLNTQTKAFSDDSWKTTEEWSVFKKAALKDASAMTKAAHKADISPRLVLSMLAVEQLRLFNTSREVYKEIFAPLNILGVQSQFSWGVMGIKQETAQEVEKHLTDTASPFYPGPQYSHLLDFSTKDTDSERFDRLIDDHDHYYSYLYGALFVKQIETQWKKAGFDISNHPEILATLYNIGFIHSVPKASPQVGGAEIQVGTRTYSFGALAAHIYYSNELLNEFPR